MTTTAPPQPKASALPVVFKVWVGAALISQLGDAALYFALGWAATAHGGAAAGLVMTMIVLPRTVLLLLGGAVGDRAGARRVMLVGDAVMFVVALTLALAAWRLGTPLALLLVAALVIGVNDAFYLPASGAMPRVLVDSEHVARATAMRQSGSQLVAMAGGPLGGAVVAYAGLPASAAVDAATFGVVLVVLLRIRPRFAPPQPAERRHIVREAADGVAVVMRTPGLRGVLCLMAAAAGFVIPVGSLLVPLLCRSRAWDASAAGLITGAQSVGTVAVTLAVTWKGTARRLMTVAAAGMVLAALGLAGLALTPSRAVAVVSALCGGAGIGLLISHLAPVLITAAPESHLTRVQSLFTLTQSAALLLTVNVLGGVAHAFGPRAGIALCAVVLGGCGAAVLVGRRLRTA
ncbi:MFS transporter [Yinghuangia seranimata]|uniref:MFS transporter n=1 Tax=Yinghuangia seranimata TaxID=408067 RepID=UPI00248C278A|nr:MFS transporter [Yinghuangia seranimata]MDI2129896.1 MFS transporter [Yinghuangia seranimata]